MTDLDSTLSALADPTRRRVIEMLRREPHRAGDIALALGMSAPATSRHLRVLRKRGLIEEQPFEEDHRVRVYRLSPEPFRELSDWLTEVEAFWGEQLESLASHVRESRSSPS